MTTVVVTGLPPLDAHLQRVGERASVLLLSGPGIDPAPYALHLLLAAVGRGAPVSYLVNNKPPAAVRREADALGFDLPAAEERKQAAIIDAYSAHAGVPSSEPHTVPDPLDPDGLLTALRTAGRGETVILDSLSSYLDVRGNGVDDILRVVATLRATGTVIALFTSWGHDAATVQRIKERFDVVLDLRAVEEVTIVRQFMFLERVGDKTFERTGAPVRVLRPGGVRVYVPKVLVTGPYRAGKTSMVKAITRSSVSVNPLGTTVALDHGTLDHKGLSAAVYGTPGQELFDPILDVLADEAVAVILVVDSGNRRSFPRAKTMLQRTRGRSLPLIVAANHWDREGHLGVEEIRKKLTLPAHVPIIPTVATEKVGIAELLDALVERLMGEGGEVLRPNEPAPAGG